MLGFIGGSGIYEALPLSNARAEAVETPFGAPSASITVGELDGREVAFVPRHGSDHEHSPTDLPYRANLFALKKLGVTHVLAANAVGSLRGDLPPRTLVVPDQIYDRTKRRPLSFFAGEGIVVHQQFARPYCPSLSTHLAESARRTSDADVSEGGTYVCIEGPQFSTVAESEFYRAQGWDVIGMTAVPEAKLAREAEMHYATLAGVTDYDVWKDGAQVTLGEVLENAERNREAMTAAVERAIRTLPEVNGNGRGFDDDCDCARALDGAINTPASAIPDATKERLEPLLGEYLRE